jgi:hypothetical protein
VLQPCRAVLSLNLSKKMIIVWHSSVKTYQLSSCMLRSAVASCTGRCLSDTPSQVRLLSFIDGSFWFSIIATYVYEPLIQMVDTWHLSAWSAVTHCDRNRTSSQRLEWASGLKRLWLIRNFFFFRTWLVLRGHSLKILVKMTRGTVFDSLKKHSIMHPARL